MPGADELPSTLKRSSKHAQATWIATHDASRKHLLGVVRRLGVTGRSRMTKAELVEAIKRANRRETAAARGD
jgi:hypothetical protein